MMFTLIFLLQIESDTDIILLVQHSKRGLKVKVSTRVSRVRYENNPLVKPRELVMKERTVKVGSARELIDVSTGEISNVNAIYQRKIVDSERFAKIYLDGLAKTFDMSKTAQRVFQSILKLCEKDTDSLWLNFMLVSKHDPDMPESTFYRGLKELLDREFVAHSDVPNKFWINPHLFFNGDRVKFITEYVKEGSRRVPDDVKSRVELETLGQTRLVD
jgi:hypothetical protein